MSSDLFNGLFEFAGASFMLLNLHVLLRDKTVEGVSLWPSVFFLTRGVWDLFYYPHLHQRISFWGDLTYVGVSIGWLSLALTYKRRNTQIDSKEPCDCSCNHGVAHVE